MRKECKALHLQLSYASLFLILFAGRAVVPCFAAEKLNAAQADELAKAKGPGLREGITASFDAKDLKEGKAGRDVGRIFSLRRRRLRNQLCSSMKSPDLRCKFCQVPHFGMHRRISSQREKNIRFTT